MAEKKDDLVQRVQNSYRQLPVVATSLNNESDKLNASAKRLETILRKHPIGVASWVHFAESRSQDGMHYSFQDVGFAKLNGKWGLAIRTVSGTLSPFDDDDVETWMFNEAPRGLRVRAVAKLPELLEQLVKDATEMIAEVTEQVMAVDFLADALESTLEQEPVERRRQAASQAKPEGGTQ